MRTVVVAGLAVACVQTTKSGTGDTGAPSTTAGACFADQVFDDGDDGVADMVGVDTYDGDWLVESTWDRDLDGTDDDVWTFTYDADGNELRREERAYGALVYWTETTWTAAGLPATWEWFFDDGSGSPIHEILVTTYDGYDHRIGVAVDHDGDGTADESTTWAVDADGNPLTDERDFEADGVADAFGTYDYDDVGRQVEYEQLLADGTPNELDQTTYTDPTLRVGTSTLGKGPDSVVVEILGFGFDADGHQTYEAYDWDVSDPAWSSEDTSTWEDGRRTHSAPPGRRRRLRRGPGLRRAREAGRGPGQRLRRVRRRDQRVPPDLDLRRLVPVIRPGWARARRSSGASTGRAAGRARTTAARTSATPARSTPGPPRAARAAPGTSSR
jgi:hypothetical protein